MTTRQSSAGQPPTLAAYRSMSPPQAVLPIPAASSRAPHRTFTPVSECRLPLSSPSLGCLHRSWNSVRAITSSPVQGPDRLCLNSPVSPGADRAKSCGLLASMRSPVCHSPPFLLPVPIQVHSPPPVFSDLSLLSSELRRMSFSFASQAAPVVGVETGTPAAKAEQRFLNWLQAEMTMASSCCPWHPVLMSVLWGGVSF